MSNKLYLWLIVMVLLVSSVFAALEDNQVLYYKSDTNGTFTDSHGSYDGTINGAEYITSGKILGAYNYDGGSDYINTTYKPYVENKSYSFWARTNDTSVFNFLGAQYDPTNKAFAIKGNYPSTTDRVALYVINGAGNNYIKYASGTNISDGNWHHIVVTIGDISNDEVRIYIDAVNYTLTSHSVTGTVGNFQTVQDIDLGQRGDGIEYYEGDLDEIGIWDKVLTQQDVIDLYNVGQGLQYPYLLNFSITASDIFTSTSINTFSAFVEGVGSFNTTDGFLRTNISKNSTGLFNIVISADGYINRTYNNINVSSNLEVELYTIGDLQINVYNQTDGTLFSQNVTLRIQNATEQRTIQIANGTGIISGFNRDIEYTLIFTSTGFGTNLYNILYDEEQNTQLFEAYLPVNDSIEITYTVNDQNGIALENALVKVERYINDFLVEVGSQLSDVTGNTVFLLDSDESVTVTISKDGYTTEKHVLNAPLATEVTFKIQSEVEVNYDNYLTGISWDFTPKAVEVSPDIVNFTFTVGTQNVNLSNFNMTLFNGTTVLGFNSSASITGGILRLSINVSPYRNQTLLLRLSLRKEGFSGFTTGYTYLVVSEDDTQGSFRATRLWFINNTTTKTRMTFWVVLFIIGMILIASASFQLFNDPLKGLILIIPYTLITGYLLAISYIVLGFIGAIMIIGVIFGKRAGGIE